MREQLVALVEGSLMSLGGFGIAVALVMLLLLRFVVPKARRSRVRAPFFFLIAHIAVVVLRTLMPDLDPENDFQVDLYNSIRVVALTLLLLSVARSFFLLILYAFLLRRGKTKANVAGIFRDIVQVCIYLVVGFVVLQQAGVEPGSLLTTSALLTAVVGLSLQDTLGNLFAGLAIQVQQPFEVGDWIQFDDEEEHIGEVLEINWRATRMNTVDRIEVTVPNNMLAKAPIRNFSKPTDFVRRRATIVAPYDTPPARMHRLLSEAVVEVKGVAKLPAPDVQTIEFSERGVEYRVRYFIEAFDQREIIDSRVRDRLWYALRRGAVPIPAPQRRVTLVEQSVAATEEAHRAQIRSVERALSAVPLFTPLSEELLHAVAIHAERRLYAPTELVIQQGDYGEELFICEKGEVDVLVDSHDGMQHVASLGKGDFFGEMSLMTGEKRKATVRCQEEVTLLVVSKETLAPVLEKTPDLANQISEMLAKRELQLDERTRAKDPSTTDVTRRSGELLSRIREFFSI